MRLERECTCSAPAAEQVAAATSGEAVVVDLADAQAVGRLCGPGGPVEGADIVVNKAGLQHVAALEDFPPERQLQPLQPTGRPAGGDGGLHRFDAIQPDLAEGGCSAQPPGGTRSGWSHSTRDRGLDRWRARAC